MINELLDFLAKKAVEVMIATKNNVVSGHVIADTASGSFKIRIEGEPYSMKYKALGNKFNQHGIDYMLDRPLQFTFTTEINFQTNEYVELKQNKEDLVVHINPAGEGEYPEKFLKSFSKLNAKINIQSHFLPEFENPRM